MRLSTHAIRDRSLIAATLVATFAGSAAAQLEQVLHSQPPNRLFGFESDTLLRDDFGTPTGQLIADRFVLNQTAEVTRASWFAFFGGVIEMVDPGPPATEQVRVRFWSDTGGLPGQVLAEQTFDNPSREFTGFTVAVTPRRKEYRYNVPLSPGFTAQAGTAYWIEVAQLGDVNSRFRWENSSTGGEYAVQYPLDTPWRVGGIAGQMAYELRTPEPASSSLLVTAALGSVCRRPRSRRFTPRTGTGSRPRPARCRSCLPGGPCRPLSPPSCRRRP